MRRLGTAASGTAALESLRGISPRELAVLAVEDLAYVKPVVIDGRTHFEIRAADGTRIGVAEEREVALAAILQHDLVPVSVH